MVNSVCITEYKARKIWKLRVETSVFIKYKSFVMDLT